MPLLKTVSMLCLIAVGGAAGCGPPLTSLGSDVQGTLRSIGDAASEVEKFSKVVRAEYHRSENRIHRLADNIEESTNSLNLVAIRLEEATNNAKEAFAAVNSVGSSVQPALGEFSKFVHSYSLDQVVKQMKPELSSFGVFRLSLLGLVFLLAVSKRFRGFVGKGLSSVPKVFK